MVLELLCECGLGGANTSAPLLNCERNKDGSFSDRCYANDYSSSYKHWGICPIPNNQNITNLIYWKRRMWLGDNCHTLDRDNLYAQKDCGIGMNEGVLKNTSYYDFEIKYFPYI